MSTDRSVQDQLNDEEAHLYFGSLDESTDYHSKLVMLRAERHDGIKITNVNKQIIKDAHIPDEFKVVKRTEPYFGTKLSVCAEGGSYMLTAPGPDTDLLMWGMEDDVQETSKGWRKLAEVAVRFKEDLPSYQYCPQCGGTINTLKHEIQAELGCCPEAQIH